MTTIYNVLRRPIVTEKTNYMNEKLHQYTFEVALDANKTLVKDAIETIFDVDVINVNIINVPPGAPGVPAAGVSWCGVGLIRRRSLPWRRTIPSISLKG